MGKNPSQIRVFKNGTGYSYEMVDYNIVKHCRACRTRFVIRKGEYKNYCNSCQLKINKEQKSSKGGKNESNEYQRY